MTLKAPKHLRGRMGNHRPELLAERAAWIKQAHTQGIPIREMAERLGISYNAAQDAARKAGCRRVSSSSSIVAWSQGLSFGSASATYDAMPHSARSALADAAAKHGKPMLHVMADFWAQHHGAQA